MIVGFTKHQVGRFYHWIGRHINRDAGYPDSDDDETDEAEEMLERTTY